MDLNYSARDDAFRAEVRAFLAANLPLRPGVAAYHVHQLERFVAQPGFREAA